MIAVVAVIALTAVVTVLLVRQGSGNGSSNAGPSASGNGPTSDIASANDTGPVDIITEEPACDRWVPINNALATREKNGWDKRDASVPATAWTPKQRGQFDTVAAAMRSAADQTMPLIKLTPHRVMRELYSQFVAYSRAYASKVPTYTAQDDNLARVSGNSSNALASICYAITYGPAATGAAIVPGAEPPTAHPLAGDVAKPQQFLSKPDVVCADWTTTMSDYDRQTKAWQTSDPAIPAARWTPDQKAVMDAVGPVLNSTAHEVEQLGRRSANPILQDFSVLGAQYLRAYVAVLPSYIGADGWLANAGTGPLWSVYAACLAAGA